MISTFSTRASNMRIHSIAAMSVLGVGMLFMPVVTHAGVKDTTKIWAWFGTETASGTEDNVGWMSTNCYNTYSTFGFQNHCDAPQYQDWAVTVDFKTGLVSGNAWIGEGDTQNDPDSAIGWVTFNYDDAFSFNGTDYNKDSTDPEGNPWILLRGQRYMARVVDDGNGGFEFQGWGRIMSIADEGRKVGQAGGWLQPNEMGDWGWIKLSGDTVGGGVHFGLILDTEHRVVRGEAFSGGGSIGPNPHTNPDDYSYDTGLGFVNGTVGPINFPYFKTEFGDIYNRQTFGSNKTVGAPGDLGNSGQYTGTYLILSSNDVKAAVPDPVTGEVIANLDYDLALPRTVNRFTNILGKIPIYGANPPLTTTVNNTQNVFGETVTLTGGGNKKSSQIFPSGNVTLDNSVVVIDGNFTIDAPLEIKNATPGHSGAGVIYVKGDLIINKPVTYDTSNLVIGGDVDKVASVVWIVEGNVSVDEDLDAAEAYDPDIVGTYFVLGEAPSGGTFAVHGVSTQRYAQGDRDHPFSLAGSVMARKFQLERTYINEFNVQDAAETFVNDGRFLVNPPRSMRDVAAALPTFSPSIPQ